MRAVKTESNFKLYPIQQLPALIAVLNLKNKSSGGKPLRKIRYLVDLEQQLWFAEEGSANKTIPAHYQMTGEERNSARCLAAGNLKFSENFREIIKINNKSGDFHPDFNSIQWLLAILIANSEVPTIQWADTVKIKKCATEACYELLFSDIATWITEQFSHTQIASFRNQAPNIKQVEYSPAESTRGFMSPSTLSLSLFASEPPSAKKPRLSHGSHHFLSLQTTPLQLNLDEAKTESLVAQDDVSSPHTPY